MILCGPLTLFMQNLILYCNKQKVVTVDFEMGYLIAEILDQFLGKFNTICPIKRLLPLNK